VFLASLLDSLACAAIHCWIHHKSVGMFPPFKFTTVWLPKQWVISHGRGHLISWAVNRVLRRIVIKDWCTKTYQFKPSLKFDNYDACKTAMYRNSRPRNLAKWAWTCCGGSTYERLLNEPSRPNILVYYLFVYALLLWASFNLMSYRH
jgi:hypothetical protein